MPGTAAERGLADPFDVRIAIPASAHYLADLYAAFGKLGLAAASYNAGPERVARWLNNSATLPLETRNYVLTITGQSAEAWADPDATLREEPAGARNCIEFAALLKRPGRMPLAGVQSERAPWGVQVSGNFSRDRALAACSALQARFEDLIGGRAPMVIGGRLAGRGTRTFYRVRVPAETRAEGEKLCAKLKAVGGSCIVLKS